jgi:hypothetical protein
MADEQATEKVKHPVAERKPVLRKKRRVARYQEAGEKRR